MPDYGYCYFSCDPGYELLGYTWDICVDGEWIDPTPTCVGKYKPMIVEAISKIVAQKVLSFIHVVHFLF